MTDGPTEDSEPIDPVDQAARDIQRESSDPIVANLATDIRSMLRRGYRNGGNADE